MTHAPERSQRGRTRPIPPPKLVSLIDGPGSPYAGSPAGWWDQYGGALDVRSGVVHLPGPTHPPSAFHPDDCPNCVPLESSE